MYEACMNKIPWDAEPPVLMLWRESRLHPGYHDHNYACTVPAGVVYAGLA
jgi:hypothetical protein